MVVGHIRRFVQDLRSAPKLSLPPTARHARNPVLSGAHAFSLKSQSEGKDAARFTRFIETTLSSGMSHGFWSSRRRWMAAVVQGEGEGKAGRKIRQRGRRDAIALVGEQVGLGQNSHYLCIKRAAFPRRKHSFEIEIESVQAYYAPPNPLALLLRKLALEDANTRR
ncbi:hypothetical protein EDB89DRAFT_1910326 [Lactarius sanguifluus]|nr:hypothetical protein EDB89DRAFT_1910326 [Lactarius sanguifluus]